MKAATVIVLFTIVGASMAYFIDDQYDGWSNGEEGANTIDAVKRRGGRNLCLPWRAPCPADKAFLHKYPFLRCCGGMSCVCTIWGNNCKCENKLGK
ncbi:uncharacterized protein [Haliotis asinina]|uniref:uncharacterized protein n=1 Tax=Haliotis asinina TaxID=109174 RepID=UPI0035321BF4